MLFSVRDIDILRLLCWCQNIRLRDLNRIFSDTELQNLILLGLIKHHEKSGTLTLTSSGNAFLQVLYHGRIPDLTLSYHESAIQRRVRFSRLMLTAYQAGLDTFTLASDNQLPGSSLFLTAITRSRGRNPWGSSRIGAIVNLGDTFYAAHYICPGIGRIAIHDELAAFHNHTNHGPDTKRAFLFAGDSYTEILAEIQMSGEASDKKLICYGDAYRGLRYPIHLLSLDDTGARQLQIMSVPDYRAKLTQGILKNAYRPPPADTAAWDGILNGRPFVLAADMNLRRIDAAIKIAKKKNCLPVAMAALEGQGDALLLSRYQDKSLVVVYKIADAALEAFLSRPSTLYIPPRTQYLTEKGEVLDAPLIQVGGKIGRSSRS